MGLKAGSYILLPFLFHDIAPANFHTSFHRPHFNHITQGVRNQVQGTWTWCVRSSAELAFIGACN